MTLLPSRSFTPQAAILLRLEEQGDKVQATEVWQGLAMRNKFQSSVLYEGHLYASDEQGLKCVEFMTGQQKWYERGMENGTLVVADGHLLILTENGELLIAPAIPAEFKPTTKAQILEGRCWTIPVLYRGRLYARNLERLVCFDLKG